MGILRFWGENVQRCKFITILVHEMLLEHEQAISELSCTSFSKRILEHNLSYENEFSFTCR